MCFHFLKLYQYHTWTSVRLVAPPCKDGGKEAVVMELFMPVCSDHAGHMRHKVPKSSPLYRELVPGKIRKGIIYFSDDLI